MHTVILIIDVFPDELGSRVHVVHLDFPRCRTLSDKLVASYLKSMTSDTFLVSCLQARGPKTSIASPKNDEERQRVQEGRCKAVVGSGVRGTIPWGLATTLHCLKCVVSSALSRANGPRISFLLDPQRDPKGLGL
jgi:hypothetical protein